MHNKLSAKMRIIITKIKILADNSTYSNTVAGVKTDIKHKASHEDTCLDIAMSFPSKHLNKS